jgi:hypothetical protein
LIISIMIIIIIIMCDGTVHVLGIEEYRIPCLGFYMSFLCNCKIMLNL